MAMSDELKAALAGLDVAFVPPPDETVDGSAWNDAVADALEKVLALDDPAAVAPLLLLLDDDYEFQDILCSLMHAAETFDRETSTAGMVEAVPTLATKAPKWARRLTGRVLNSTAHRVALAEALVTAPAEARVAFRGLFDDLQRENAAQFASSVWWITTRLDHPLQ